MKKSLIFLASAGFLVLAGCGKTSDESNVNTGKSNTTEKKEDTISFEKDSYTINPKDKVTVKEAVSGVVYSFQGGAPEGVTLDSTTGEIDFDAYANPIPEKVYIATYNGKTATTIIKFNMQQEKPVLTFQNLSDYLVDGDIVYCTAKTDKGREYAVSYSLKENVDGISINAETGRVSFSDKVNHGTSFIVVAESQGVTSEKSFIVMKDNIIFSENDVILEKGSNEDALFTLNFNGNSDGEKETTQNDVKLIVDDVIVAVEGFTYDKESKTVTIPHSYLATLGSGEHNLKVTTKRNNVPLSLAIADKIIYDATDFITIFEADYSTETPTFKEGSLSGYYTLGCDIDLSDVIKANGDWAPIGAYSDGIHDVPFTGTFNGNGYTISGFSYNGMAPVNGLFGRNKGTIKNFRLNGEIKSAKSWSGALVGNNAGTIENIIMDVSLVNEGQNATGVLCSVNHGTIQNCLSINENVVGNIDPDLSWKQSGLLVGLNETDGSIKNSYAVGNGNLFGYSQNTEVTEESAGKVFDTIAEMKAYDFSNLPTHYFNVEENALPTLKTLSIPHTPGYFAFGTLPTYALKGDSVALSAVIKPFEREAEYKTYLSYSIEGENYGATIVDNSLSLANVAVPEEGATLTLKATLKIDQYGIDLSTTADILVYNSISGLKIANNETILQAGDTIELKTATTPESDIQATFNASTTPVWKGCYFTLSGNKLSIKDDCPDGLEITVTASAIGETAEKTFTVKKLNTLDNSNVIHYKDDVSSFSYTLSGVETIKNVAIDGASIENTKYTYSNNTLTLDSSLITKDDIQHVIKITDNNDNSYRAFATSTNEEKVTEEWLNNAFGATGYKKISSLSDFYTYFAVDGATHSELVSNMSQSNVYALTADLDFSGVDFHAIGENLGSSDGTIFNGKFYGLGHTIKNVSIQKDGSNWGDGFFRQIGGEGVKAVVQDINFENCTINKTGGDATGILAGYVGDSSQIRNINVFSSTVIAGDDQPFNHATNLAGVVGRTWSSDIKYCTFNGYNINLIGNK